MTIQKSFREEIRNFLVIYDFFSLIYCQLLSGYNLNQLALTLQPDINALAEDLCFNQRPFFILLQHLGSWQSVKDIFIAAAP